MPMATPKLRYAEGDLFEYIPWYLSRDRTVLIPHCCNDVGAWGAGFVVPLGRNYPEAEKDYLSLVSVERRLGTTRFIPCDEGKVIVCNMIGQHGIYPDKDGTPPICYDYLFRAMDDVAMYAKGLRHSKLNPHIVCPMFGSGLAGGDWTGKIVPEIKELWIREGIPVTVFVLK